MTDILAVGECLIDMTPKSEKTGVSFVPNPGGAPCNYLAMAASAGAKTGFIGKVGHDPFGLQLKKTLDEAGIDTSGLILDEVHPTTLAFVHLDNEGERSFSFYRKQCADLALEIREVDINQVINARVVHFGSLSFTDEPSRSTVLKILETAKENGCVITYDPNYRPLLWPDKKEANKGMSLGLSFVDIIKVSDEEALLITGEKSLDMAAAKFIEQGVKIVCITRGGEGVNIYSETFTGEVPGFKTRVIDTTGAGDVFFGGFMGYLVTHHSLNFPIDKTSLKRAAVFGNAAASICVNGFGGIPSVPGLSSVKKKLNSIHE